MSKYTEQQKMADKKWREKKPELSNYLKSRSSARSFIKNKAELVDLEEFEKLIVERREKIINENL
jgi:hypothetical protein